MTLHIPEKEWHVFEYEEGGSLEILFIMVPKLRCDHSKQRGMMA